MKKLKVGLFIDTFFPMIDGVINVVDNQAKILSDRFDITVFTVKPPKKKKDTIDHPYKVVRSKTLPVFFLDYDLPTPGLDKQFKKTLKNSDLDVVYFHSPMSIAKQGVKYAKKHNIPIISHMHSQFKRDFYRATHSKLLTKLLLNKIMKVFNQSDCAVAVNEFTRDLFVNEYGLKSPVKVVYNATDMTPLENLDEAKQTVDKMYNLSSQEKIFSFVGRVNKLKNIDLILDSLAILKEKYQNFKFLIVGVGGDEDYFKNKVKKLQLEDKVLFTGRISDRNLLKSIYARSDLILFPSHYDTDGLIKFEAAAQKTPVVYVENTGAASSIIDNETGFIAKNDAISFADKIYQVVTDEELYNKVSSNLQTKLYRTWNDSAEDIAKVIIDAVEEKKKEGANEQK